MVSIVIPVYNVEDYLQDCVNSVISQTYRDLQIILVDDGSTDSGGDICDAFAEKDKRIQVIHKKNGGLSDARNVGTAAAKGEFLFYLDSDDYLEKNAIRTLLDEQALHGADVVVGNYFYTYHDHEDAAQNDNRIPDRDTAIRQLMLGEIQTFAWGKLIRTELAKKHEFPVGTVFEDHFWTHLIFYDSNVISCISQPILHYRQRQNSISFTFTEKRLDILKGHSARISFLQETYPQFLTAYLERCANDAVSIAWLILTRMKKNRHGFEILQGFIAEYNLTAHCSGKTAQLLRSIQHGRLAYAIRAIRYRIVKKVMKINLKHKLIQIVYGFFRKFPIRKNRVLLFSYYGEQHGGAPKYIGAYLKEHSDLNVIRTFVNPAKYSGIFSHREMVRYGHIGYYYMLATAGTILTDYRMTEEFFKRPGQRYIQTWHSSLRLKQIENDAADTLPEGYVRMAKRDSTQIDVLLAGSKKSKEIFEQAFWYDGPIAETGTPQCDILVRQDRNVIEKVMSFFRIPKGSHVAIYAPTFRKGHDTSVYDLNPNAVLKALRERFGGEWYLLIRLHPHLKNCLTAFEYSEHVKQATDYDDVQELLCAADFLISDYSAIIFDFSVTAKPCMLYTPDLKSYLAKDRKLYFDIDTLPFRSFEKQEELLQAIRQFDEDSYQNALHEFRNSIGSYDDGKACNRVMQLIRKGL